MVYASMAGRPLAFEYTLTNLRTLPQAEDPMQRGQVLSRLGFVHSNPLTFAGKDDTNELETK